MDTKTSEDTFLPLQGCRYEGKRYEEDSMVRTSEPCLQCRCVEGSLRCRLRVCPRLPQPVPVGCRTRPPGENVCCPEILCGTDDDENENTLQRSKTEISHHARVEEVDGVAGCLYEGVRYGPGSAMMGSRPCEYCYCISGVRRCIRPKCLLPLPGCAPRYARHSCCPVAYNCTRQIEFSTTLAAISGNGCRTRQHVYQEGEMVRDIPWKATCDNCFCAMGAIRCVPLACAPPLQGCKPIVRKGQCCPSTYNCRVLGGTIEVQATQNYASYAFISKDYAKFRKETNFYPAIHDTALSSVEGRGHRVVNEAPESNVTTSTPKILTEKMTIVTETIPTLETETMNNEILGETTDYPKYTTREQEQITATTTEFVTTTDASTIDQSTTTVEEDTITEDGTESTSHSEAYLREVSTTVEDTPTETPTTPTSVTGTFLMDEETTGTTVTPITEVPESTSVIATSKPPNDNCANQREDAVNSSTEKPHPQETTQSTTQNSTTSSITRTNEPPPTNVTTKIPEEKMEIDRTTLQKNKQSVKQQDNKVHLTSEDKMTVIGVKKPSSGLSTSILVPDDMLVMNVTVKTNVAVGHLHGVTINPISKPIPPDIEAILNITNRGKDEDYEYDYSEPTLPPSLPNVRIIPFVAADALVKDKDEPVVPSTVTGYPSSAVAALPPELVPNDANFYDIVTQENRFNPPEKTEGGFVPRQPSYFDPIFHTADLNLEIGTGVTVVPETIAVPNSHRKHDNLPKHCLYEENEYGHGQVLPSRNHCVTCICYDGEIVCSNQKCPSLKIGCQRVRDSNDKCCHKVMCAEGMESPTVVLDRVEPPEHEPTVLSDPFRDVIKTEPAPDLPSLIGDMMIPYLAEPTVITASPIHLGNLDEFVHNATVDNPTDRNLVSQDNATNFTDVNPITVEKVEEKQNDDDDDDDDDSIFSLDTVLDLFFTDTTTTAPRTRETTSKLSDNSTVRTTSVTTSLPSSTTTTTTTTTTSNSTTTETTTTTTTSPPIGNSTKKKTFDDDSSTTLGLTQGILKLAGCDIYGQVYRVGRIIVELSDSCHECRCTEIGVQCKSLDC